MDKTLYLVGGTMGVGKTTCCQMLKSQLPACVFLDGDWCWDMHPFQVTEQTKKMVLDNICYMLNNFLACDAYETVIFCWVMHQQPIINQILSRLSLTDCKVKVISLICKEDALIQRLQKDVQAGIRKPDVITRSVARMPLYDKLNTYKIDVSNLTALEVVKEMKKAPCSFISF